MSQETVQNIETKKYASPEIETVLASRSVEKTSPLRGGMNQLALLELKDDGSAVFKYRAEDGVESQERMRCERASYLIDLFLRFDLVPSTVIRRWEEKGKSLVTGKNEYIGTFQQYIADAKTGYELEESDWPKNELLKMDILDYILKNFDRNDSNWLAKDNKVYAIDNEFTLTYHSDRESPMRQFGRHHTLDMAVPGDVHNKLSDFVKDENKKNILRDLLTELINGDSIDRMFKRAEIISKIIDEQGAVRMKNLKHLSEFK